jgi:hypothetical protein
MPDLDFGDYDVFVRWLYSNRVLWDLADSAYAEALRDIYPLGTHPNDHEDGDRYITVLMKAYILADRMFARGY